jgi:hypothetical protein
MSVDLTISFPGRETEFVSMCSQRTGEEWVGEIARKHGFRILTGVYPTLIFELADLNQVILEVGILREEMFRLIKSDTRLSDFDKACNCDKWDRLLARLQQLKLEMDWKAYFG